MASAVAPGGAAAPQRYFCHQCNRTITLTPSPAAELSCPICHGGFLEEFDLPSPNPSPSPSPFMAFHASSADPFFASPSAAFPLLFSSASGRLRNPSDLAAHLGPDPSSLRSPSPDTEPFNPLLFFQNYIQNLVADGANIQVVFEGPGDGPFPGANPGDYFIGPGLEQLIQQLAENDPNRYGTPPAAKSAVESLLDITISSDLLASDDAQCAVCKDTFEIRKQAKQMPCKHIYHKECILPWLELHNTCPVCRYELPTDDPDYEQRQRGEHASAGHAAGAVDPRSAGGLAAAGTGEGDSPGPRTVERRFRISLPWPLRAFGWQAEASSAGDDTNIAGNQGGRDANSGGRGDHSSEPRQEDLD